MGQMTLLEQLAAQFVWEMRREADKVAQEADYQNDGPLVSANRLRSEAGVAEDVLSAFVAWAKEHGHA